MACSSRLPAGRRESTARSRARPPIYEALSAAAVQRLASLSHELFALDVALLEAPLRQAHADVHGTDTGFRSTPAEIEEDQQAPAAASAARL